MEIISGTIILFGILYMGSFIGQSVIDWFTSELEKNHESQCDKTEHWYQYSDGDCKTRQCRDKKGNTHVII